MTNAYFTIARPKNDPFLGYLPGSKERKLLKAELDKQASGVVKIPLIINGKEVYTDKTVKVTIPHDHQHVIAECCMAGEKELNMAIDASLEAKEAWENMPWEHRSAIFLKAADMITGSYRPVLNASTMLGQSKTVFQAEIDIAEMADFLRFGVWSAQEIFKDQPASSDGIWNRQDYRPLDGFVCAITPFNFTSIAGNLPTAPAIAGNVALWKPSTTAVLSNYYYMKLLMWCGLPAGVINFVPCSGSDMSEYVVSHPKMAGFHFTGSTRVFQTVWRNVGQNIANYSNYPRLVGETGGKDFIFAHNTADIEPLSAAIVRGSFEYQGQKCSACSRAYIPASIWPSVKERLTEEIAALKVGDVREFDTFMAAVIDKASFETCRGFIDRASASPDCDFVAGGTYDDSKGWFIQPTVILCKDPLYESMVTEIFGPIVSVYVYDDDKLDETLKLCDTSSPYALTGAVFAQDREAIVKMENALRHASGNFYINDKCTGAVVGQQPFGGARASGTNDKAGTTLNMMRWISSHTVKESFCPSSDITYPYMSEK
ncbi:L-glutamate gamma-semialdehyde dehydrogenase [uncultured Clostridium sp.]|uniref:L-glutamate gamma-semialdehyde dehydrogenase n=1 Tax=uncultured Clostridium sp. TaxID=59620 RepID=UPI0025DBB86E|nr:L-glutamate gamma-semialdehyde dehydrogenase [uncultured Clostridium sp.]